MNIGVKLPSAEKLLEARREAWNRSFSHSLTGANPVDTWILDFQPPEQCDSAFLWFELPSRGHFVMAAQQTNKLP